MSRRAMTCLMILLGLLSATNASALPDRLRMIVHESKPVTDRLGVSLHLLPAPNLLTGLSPLGFVQMDIKATSWLVVSPTIGHTFAPRGGMIAAIRTAPKKGAFWGSSTTEWTLYSGNIYWLVLAEYELFHGLSAGVEEESWLKEDETSHGGGFNVIFRLKYIQVDIAPQWRLLPNGDIANQIFMRWHFFLG